MSFIRVLFLAGAVLASCLPVACGFNDASHRCGTEVPDPADPKLAALVGCVENPDQQPAVSARVIAWPSKEGNASGSDSGAAKPDTQLTDRNGRFVFGNELAPGDYELYFEDSLSLIEKRPVQRVHAAHGFGHLILPSVRLVPPTLLDIWVRDHDTHEPIAGVICSLEGTPYDHVTTGSEGIAHYYVPPGSYQVSCILPFSPWTKGADSIVVPPGASNLQMVLYPTPNGEEPPPLPPPSDFSLAYDENSGVVNLTWSRVTDARLLKYGIRRVDVDAGGGAQEFAVNDTTYPDVPFASGDSVQMKTLLYSVYSLKRDPGGYSGASRSQSLRLEARRPWAYGPRIDSIVRADTGRTYRPGDTVRIIASWTNRIRGNDSLFWRVGGPSPFVLARAHPPASGADTLAFALPAAGDYPISLTLKDAEGYRSWLSVPFRF